MTKNAQKSVHTPLQLSPKKSNDRIEAESWKSRPASEKTDWGGGVEAFLLQKDGLARGKWHLALENMKCAFLCYVVIKSYKSNVYNCEPQIHHDELYQTDPICMHTQTR